MNHTSFVNAIRGRATSSPREFGRHAEARLVSETHRTYFAREIEAVRARTRVHPESKLGARHLLGDDDEKLTEQNLMNHSWRVEIGREGCFSHNGGVVYDIHEGSHAQSENTHSTACAF